MVTQYSGIRSDKLSSNKVEVRLLRFWKDKTSEKAFITLIMGDDRSMIITSGVSGGSEEEIINRATAVDTVQNLKKLFTLKGFNGSSDFSKFIKYTGGPSINQYFAGLSKENREHLLAEINDSKHGLDFLDRLDSALRDKYADSRAMARTAMTSGGIPVTHLTAPDPSDPFPDLGIGIMPGKIVVDKDGNPVYVSGTATPSFHDPGDDLEATIDAVEDSVTATPMKTLKSRTKKEDSAPAPDIFKADDWGSW